MFGVGPEKKEACMRKRILYDVILTLLLVFEMLYQVTGNAAHEAVGAAFFLCIIAHVFLNRKWIGNTASSVASRSLAKRNKMLLVVACLLAVDMILLVFSSLIISETLWNAGLNLSALNPGNMWYPIHVGCSYALCILVLFHLSLHWASVAEVLRVEYDPERREAIGAGVNAVLTIGAIALGIGGIMRTSFEASDFAVSSEEDPAETKTVASGYRERNAETGEIVEDVDLQIVSESGEGSSALSDSESFSQEAEPRCSLCPRQCKLSAPRCEKPYEQGLI